MFVGRVSFQTTHNRSRSTVVDEESDESSAEQYVDSSSSDYFVPSPGKRRPSRSSRHGPSSSGSSKKRRPSSSSAKESATPRSSRPAGQIVTDNRTVAGYAEWMHRQQQQQDNEGQQHITRQAEPKVVTVYDWHYCGKKTFCHSKIANFFDYFASKQHAASLRVMVFPQVEIAVPRRYT